MECLSPMYEDGLRCRHSLNPQSSLTPTFVGLTFTDLGYIKAESHRVECVSLTCEDGEMLTTML